MARKKPTLEVVRRLFALSGNQCAFPGCTNQLIDEKGTFLAEICHITAANSGGERHNEEQSDDDRRAFENLVLFCHPHHKVTDDVATYSVPTLLKIKEDHERNFLQQPFQIPQVFEDKVFKEFNDKLDDLTQTIRTTLNAVQEGNELGQKTHHSVIKTHDSVVELKRTVESFLLNATLATDTNKIYAEQLEFIKQFRKENKPQTALTMLLKYKEEHWDKIGGELRYKVIANLGSLYFDLGKKIDGAKQLLELKDVDFQSPDSLAYLCLAYAILGMREEFGQTFTRAEALQSDNVNLWLAYIHLHAESKTADEIEEALPESVLNTSQIAYALGETFLDGGQDDKGFELLQKSIDLVEGGIEEKWHLVSLVEAKKLLRIATVSRVILKQFNSDDINALKNSRDVLSTVWCYVERTELAVAAWHVVLNRGIVNKILGDKLAAEHDLEEAWRLSRSFVAFKDLFLHYIDTGRFERAEVFLPSGEEVINNTDDAVEFAACQARLYSAQQMPDKAVEALESKLEDADDYNRLRLLDLITLAYFQCGAYGKAMPYAERMSVEFSTRPEGFLAEAVCHRMLNQPERAFSTLENAFDRAEENTAMPYVWFQIGLEYSGMKEHDKAIVCFEKIEAPNGFGEVHRKLLFEYYYAEEFQKAIDLALRVKAIASSDMLANEILFRAYHESGRNELAETALEEYLEIGKKESLDHFRLLGVSFYNDIGESDKSVQLILKIERPAEFSLHQRLGLARQLIESDATEAGLEMAFDARLDHYGNAEAHEMYIQCYLSGAEQPQDVLYPNEVKMDCAVFLVNKSGAEKTFFLTDDKRYQSAEIVRSDDNWTRLLLGKKFGDSITMPNSFGVGSELTVNSIMNKHVYAFRESGELLETKFSGETKMQFLKWDNDDDFSMLNEFIKKNALASQQSRREGFKFYEGDVMTVGMLAHYFHRNFVEMWFEIVHRTDTYLRCYGHDESPAISNAISGKHWIVVDPIALLTNLILLPDSNLLNEFGDRCIVAQSTLTELKLFWKELEMPGPKLSVGFEEGQMRAQEYTQESNDNTRKVIGTVIEWCEENATIKSPVKSTKRTRNYKFDIVSVVGQAFHDSVVLAQELNGMLLSDDARLKSFALGEFNLQSFSTYQIAVHKASNGRLPVSEFSELSKTLMRANYAYLPISGADLWALFDESRFQFRPPFSRGVRGLRILLAPYCAQTLVSFAKLLYLNVAVASLREQAILYVLQEAKRNVNYREVKSLLLRLLEREFRLMPIQKVELTELINTLPSQL